MLLVLFKQCYSVLALLILLNTDRLSVLQSTQVSLVPSSHLFSRIYISNQLIVLGSNVASVQNHYQKYKKVEPNWCTRN